MHINLNAGTLNIEAKNKHVTEINPTIKNLMTDIIIKKSSNNNIYRESVYTK